jgi:AraC-like DNA-binding protein
MHFAAELRRGVPDIEAIAFYPTPKLRQITDLVETLISFEHSTSHQRETVTRGAMLALLAMLADLADGEIPPLAQGPQRIFQLKWIVRDQLFSPDLTVTSIARQLNCTPDYLSYLFHRETGDTLIHYIHQQRILGAAESLANSALSVSEIAWACGFSDAGYFSRIFRRAKGVSPLAFRRKTQQQRRSVETQPKTIYHKRADYSAGQPWIQRGRGQASASVRAGREPRAR